MLEELEISKDLSTNTVDVDYVDQKKDDKRCVQKVVMEEKIEYEDVVECEHSYDKRCFTSLSTVFKPTQVKQQKILFLVFRN